jgi:hypothetical protein
VTARAPAPEPAPAPVQGHVWAVGSVSLFWNAMGAYDYTMTELRSTTYLAAMTPPQIAWLNAIPAWAVALWAIGTWGGVTGSLLLLARRRFAVTMFAVSLIGVIGITLFQIGAPMPQTRAQTMPSGADLLFKATILAGAVALLCYAQAMRRRGLLSMFTGDRR